MDTYEDMLICACCQVYSTAHTLNNVAIEISLLGELKELDGWIDDDNPISLEVLHGMKDPLLRKMATVIQSAYEIINSIRNRNSFTEEEMMPEEDEDEPSGNQEEMQPANTRVLLLNRLLDHFYSETCQVGFYLSEMCFINGYKNRLTEYSVFNYFSNKNYGDENVKQLSHFGRIMTELIDYIEEQEPGNKYFVAVK